MPFLHFRQGILPIYQKVLRQETQSWVTESIATIAIPLSFFLAFGLGLKDYIQDVEGVSYLAFLSPGLVTMTILLEAYRTGGWGLWLDRWYQRMLDEYRIKPITTSDIIIGEILGGFTVALVKGAIVAGILMLMTPIRLPWGHVLPYLMILLPGSVLFTCVGAMIGTVFRKPDHIAQIQTILITPLLYLGGLFFPVSSFPPQVVAWVRWLPTTPLFEGGRAAWLHGQLESLDMLLLWGSAALSFVACTWLFNQKLSE